MRKLLFVVCIVLGFSGCLSHLDTEHSQGDYLVVRGTIEQIRYVPDHHDPLWMHTELKFQDGTTLNLRGIAGILIQGTPAEFYHAEEYGGAQRRIYMGMKITAADPNAISYGKDGFVYISGVIDRVVEYRHSVCPMPPGNFTTGDSFSLLRYRSGVCVALYGARKDQLPIGAQSTLAVRHHPDGKGWPVFFQGIETF